MNISTDDAADLERGRLAAERAAAMAPDLPDMALLAATRQALVDLELLRATFLELEERLVAGPLDFESRQDLAVDGYTYAGKAQAFALTVLG